MEKFTKGEWSSNGFSTVLINGEPLCAMVNSAVTTGDPAEDYANAHLVAAAPEMYAMLKQVSELVDMDGGSAIDWIIENTFDIRELLAKARGEK